MTNPVPPLAQDLAWLALIPTTAPGLTTSERARITRIRAGVAAWPLGDTSVLPDPTRILARCDALLAT